MFEIFGTYRDVTLGRVNVDIMIMYEVYIRLNIISTIVKQKKEKFISNLLGEVWFGSGEPWVSDTNLDLLFYPYRCQNE